MLHDVLSLVFLIAVISSPFLLAVVVVLRSNFSFPQAFLYFGALLLTRLLWRARLPAALPIREGVGAVIVCNHRSSIDPFFIQVCSFGRTIHWMVAREYCEHFAFRWFLKTCEVIPVGRRGVDTAATKLAIRYVSNGDLVGMFPEGRINLTDKFMLPIRPGAAVVAAKARVPLVPCHIEGSPFAGTPWSPLFMSTRSCVRFGEFVSPPATRGDNELKQTMTVVIKAIAAMAGRPDFEPQFAGRRWLATPQVEEEQTVENSS